MSRRPPRRVPPRSSRYNDNDYYKDYDYMDRDPDRDRSQPPDKKTDKKSGLAAALNWGTIAILMAVFVVGIGIGTALSSATPAGGTGNVATSYDIDRSAPNPEMCVQYGASAIATDMRVFVTLRPFNVYVTQPKMQPGCVLRSSNWNLLQTRNLLNSKELNDCRNRLNTFAFTGDIERGDGKAQVNCVYQNDRAGNLFLPQDGTSTPSETDRF